MPIKNADKLLSKKEIIIDYLAANPAAKTAEISEIIGTKDRRTRDILKEMVEDGIIEPDGGNRNRIYMLKR